MAKATRVLTEFYAKKLKEYGPNSDGVGWGSREKHLIRLRGMIDAIGCEKIKQEGVIDVGCGYGELLDVFQADYEVKLDKYLGIDSSAEMIEQALRRFPTHNFVTTPFEKLQSVNGLKHILCCGVFTQKANASDSDMYDLIRIFLDAARRFQVNTMTFNLMSPLCEDRPQNLFYPEMGQITRIINNACESKDLNFKFSNEYLHYELMVQLNFGQHV